MAALRSRSRRPAGVSEMAIFTPFPAGWNSPFGCPVWPRPKRWLYRQLRPLPAAHAQNLNPTFHPAANPPRAPAHRSGMARGGAGAPGILQDRPWTLLGAPAETMMTAALAMKRAGKAETNIVVPVRGRVPFPVGGAEVLRIVVPGTTADHAVGAKSRSGLVRSAFAPRPRIARFSARVWA